MKAVKGYTKNDYIAICKEEEGGEVFNFKSMCEAVEYIAKFLPGSSKKEAVARIINDTNCDWVFFEDESVIFRYYGKGYDETIAFFGDEIIDETTGEIDRPKLASVIFSNPNKRIVLNSIIHPVVKKEIVSMITQAKIDNKYDYIFVEAALLLDDHYNVFCDETWYIYADEDSRRKRLKESRGYSDEKIDGIIKSQLGEEEFKKGCDIVVDNSGNINDTYAQLVKLLQM